MAPEKRTTYIEMDRYGRIRQVRGRPRSGLTDSELLNVAEEEIRMLRAEGEILLDRLSVAEANTYKAQNNYRVVCNEHSNCRDRIQTVQARLEDEHERNETLQQEMRLLRRTSHHDDYRRRYEEALRELANRDELIRLETRRLADRDRRIVALNRTLDARDNTIILMQNALRREGLTITGL